MSESRQEHQFIFYSQKKEAAEKEARIAHLKKHRICQKTMYHSVSSVVMMLCVGVALVSGGVVPFTDDGGQGVGHYRQYVLLVPLDTDAVTTGLPSSFNSGLRKLFPHRVRREVTTDGGVDHTPDGTTVDAKVTGTLYQNGPHTVTGNAHVERTYHIPDVGTGPLIYGGGVTYDHATRGGANVDVTRTPMGTELTATGRGTVWQSNDRSQSVDAYGSFSRSYGGPWGTSRPDYGVGATYTWRF